MYIVCDIYICAFICKCIPLFQMRYIAIAFIFGGVPRPPFSTSTDEKNNNFQPFGNGSPKTICRQSTEVLDLLAPKVCKIEITGQVDVMNVY